jgi:pimeloyl-ACP methyl ester carboxylesterase
MINKYIEEFVPINGINQYFLHFQGHKENPVILYLHGGPGMSEALFAHYNESENNEEYTVVYYDQRGTGKTYTKNKEAAVSIELLKQDLFETVQYLKNKYNKDKLIILGHSFGSILGTMYSLENPEDVLCYIGVGQVVNTIQSEKNCYNMLLERANKENDYRTLKKLEQIGAYPLENLNEEMIKKITRIRKLEQKYNLVSGFDRRILKLVLKSPSFELTDLISMIKGYNVNQNLYYYLGEFNLNKYSTSYEVPVYYIVGENDFLTSIEILEEYFESVEAKDKKIYTIKNAGHFPMLDNLKEYENAIKDIIFKVTK